MSPWIARLLACECQQATSAVASVRLWDFIRSLAAIG